MYYSAIGLLAILILLIENHDILDGRNEAFRIHAWKVYRKFLFAVLLYYVIDIMWGVLEYFSLGYLLFADTTVYFVAIAAGVLFWAEYTVLYLGENNLFGRFLVYAGRVLSGTIIALTTINIFLPVLFVVAKDPSQTQRSMLISLLAPLSSPTRPPWVPSPLLLLLMLTELRQLVSLSEPCDSDTKPPAYFALVVMVPATERFLMTAFLTLVNTWVSVSAPAVNPETQIASGLQLNSVVLAMAAISLSAM